MTRVLVLLLLLAGSFGLFLARGLPQAARVERSASALRERERALLSLRAGIDPAKLAEFAELSARHERAQEQALQRRSLLTEGRPDAAPAALAEQLDGTQLGGLRRPSPLADALRLQAAASATAESTLRSIVHALPVAEGLTVEELALRDDGRPRALPELGLQEVEAQLVLAGALPDVLAALERLAPERGAGLPILSVRSASLRRIEPERWGGVVRELPSPPVRLSCTLAVLFAEGDGG